VTRAAAALAALGLAAAAPAAGQVVRDFRVERPHRGEPALRAVVDFAAGELFVRPAASGALYAMHLRYDTARVRPRTAWDPDRGIVHLGVERLPATAVRTGDPEAASLAVIDLSPAVELSLEARLGASASSLELGGLRLAELDVSTGASRTEIRFSRPATGACRRAQVTTGAAEVLIRQAGHAGCRRWTVEGGVGQVTLDLAGDWPGEARVAVRMTVGGVRLEAPRALGIRLRLSRFLASFSPEGFTREGNVYTSAGAATAARVVDVDVDATLGRLEVVWK
jgi:hypothetical protein